ncbi:MAG: TonB family protein [Acidobacteria bacterium]|nr:TonB family protein [Acidobacteriota bacterium]
MSSRYPFFPDREGPLWPYLAWAVAGHGLLLGLVLLLPRILPEGSPILIGTGPGGGQGGDILSVGLVDEWGGGAGQYKPSLKPQPPVPQAAEKPAEARKPEPKKAVALPDLQKKKSRRPDRHPEETERVREKARVPPNYVPPPAGPGAGGNPASAGSGGGFGGGHGVSIGPGTGTGFADSWYARQVEQRIGSNWLRSTIPALTGPQAAILSFSIRADGRILNVRFEQRSGVEALDLSAERALRASDPLPPLPFEYRPGPVKFMAYFEYPPK